MQYIEIYLSVEGGIGFKWGEEKKGVFSRYCFFLVLDGLLYFLV